MNLSSLKLSAWSKLALASVALSMDDQKSCFSSMMPRLFAITTVANGAGLLAKYEGRQSMLLSVDGGAERLGWAILDKVGGKPVYYDSGLVSFPAYKPFQKYRLDLIDYYVDALTRPGSVFDNSFAPVTQVVNETVPAVGSFGGTQMYLVNVAMSVVQTIARLAGIPVDQIAARTVQSRIAVGPKRKKVSKVQVRNGVFQLLPELEYRKSDWTKVFDEPDSIATGLAYLGFVNGS
jgi:Holliday junction resolvasome RuvABC endonuclease subunit